MAGVGVRVALRLAAEGVLVAVILGLAEAFDDGMPAIQACLGL